MSRLSTRRSIIPMLDPSETPKVRLCRDVERSIEEVHPELRELFRQLCRAKEDWPLYLWGDIGSGKTLASLALCDYCQFADHITIENLCSNIMDRDRDRDEMARIQAAKSKLIVLDEIGARRKTGDLEYSAVIKTLDAQATKGFGLICISNIAPKDLYGMFDQRLVSRLVAGTVFNLAGGDRRKK